jgi:glycosyltransferase involved in cell wall biosynthesis
MEEKLIGRVIETMPDYVGRIVLIIDDSSKDKTGEMARLYLPQMGERLLLIQHKTNQGMGGDIATGHKWCRDHEMAWGW